MTDPLLTVEQAAQRLGVHPKTIRRQIRAGRLPGRKLGGRWRVPESAVAEWVETPTTDAEAEVYEAPTPTPTPSGTNVHVSTVVDLYVAEVEEANLLTASMTAIMNGPDPSLEGARMATRLYPEQRRLRVMLWGGLPFVGGMLSAIEVFRQAHAPSPEES